MEMLLVYSNWLQVPKNNANNVCYWKDEMKPNHADIVCMRKRVRLHITQQTANMVWCAKDRPAAWRAQVSHFHMYVLMSHWENSVEIIPCSHTGRTKLMEWKGQCIGQQRRLSTHLNTRVSRQTHTMLFGQLASLSMLNERNIAFSEPRTNNAVAYPAQLHRCGTYDCEDACVFPFRLSFAYFYLFSKPSSSSNK